MSITISSVKKLIIADDDPDDQMLLKEALEDYLSYLNIIQVGDGLKLMQQLQNTDLPDLVLLDLNMPNKDGIECLKEIKSSDTLRHLPIVVLSTSKRDADMELCFSNGAHLFFTKPCAYDSLKQMLHYILSIDWKRFPINLSKKEFMHIAEQGKPNLALVHSA
jgi:CheY-like chemotaxis protein